MANVDEANLQIGVDVDLSKLSQTIDLFKGLDKFADNINNNFKQSMDVVDRFSSAMSSLTHSVKENSSGMREAYSLTIDDTLKSLDRLESKINDMPDGVDFTFDDSQLSSQLRHTRDKINDFNADNPISPNLNVHKANRQLDDWLDRVKRQEESMPKSMPTPAPRKDVFDQWHSAFGRINKDTNLFTSAADRAQDHADRFKRIVSGAAIAGMVSNGVINSWYALSSGIKSAIKSGMDYDKEQQRMGATWITLRGTQAKSRQMVNQINKYSMATGQDTDLVDELEQGFYHLHSNYGESNKMTSAMLNMTDAVGIDKQQALAARQDMVNGLSRGNANAGLLNQISQYFPMFREQLAKDMNTKVTKLTGMAKAGDISGQQVEKTFEYLGLDKYKDAADNMMKTMFGMQRTISSQLPRLMGAMEKPIFKAQSPIYEALSKWVTSDKTTDLFKAEGKAIASVFDSIIKLFPALNNTKSATNLLNNAMKGLIKYTNRFAKFIRDNPDKIKALGSSLKEMTHTGFDVLIDSLKILDVLLKPLSKFATAHPKQFADIAAGYIVVTRAIAGLTTAIGLLIKAGGGFKTALNIGDAIGGSFMPSIGGKHFSSEKALVGDRIFGGVKRSFKNRTVAKDIGSGIKGMFTNGGRLGRDAEDVEAIGKHAAPIGRFGKIASFGARRVPLLGTALSLAPLATMNKKNRSSRIGGAAGGIAGGIAGSFLGPIGSIAGSIAGQVGGEAIGSLMTKSGRKNAKKYVKAFNSWSKANLPKGVSKSITSSEKEISKSWDSLTKSFKPVEKTFKNAEKTIGHAFSTLGKTWNKYVEPLIKKLSPLGKMFQNIFADKVKFAINIFTDVLSTAIKVVAHVVQAIGGYISGVAKVFKGVFDFIHDLFTGKWKKLWGDAGEILGGFHKMAHSALKGVYNIFSDIFSGIGKLVKHTLGFVGDMIHDVGKGISKVWNKLTKGGHGHHASGGKITRNEVAYVGEEGVELRDHAGTLSLVGLHGKQLMPLSVNDKIYTNSQLKDFLTGRQSLRLNGYAKGTGATTLPAFHDEVPNFNYKSGRITGYTHYSDHVKDTSKHNDKQKDNHEHRSRHERRSTRSTSINMTKIEKTVRDSMGRIERIVKSSGLSSTHVQKNYLSGMFKALKDELSRMSKTVVKSNKTQNVKITGKVSPDLKSSINSLKKSLNIKSFNNALDKIDDQIDKFIKNEVKSFNNFGNQLDNSLSKSLKSSNSDTDSLLDKLRKNWDSHFNNIEDNQNGAVKSMNKYLSSRLSDSLDDYTKFGKNLNSESNSIVKEWKSDWSDFSDAFQHEMNKLPDYAKNSMSDVVSNINRGVSSINKLLAKFGGHGSVLPAIHYATGTMNGRIAYPHLGILNDSPVGERQEAIIRDNNVIYPKGNDAVVPLAKNDIILNGEQTKQGIETGMLPHYKKGTISQKRADSLTKILNKRNNHPKKYFNSDYQKYISASKGLTGLGQSLLNVSNNINSKYGQPWYSEAFSQLSSAAKDGSASGGSWRHNPGMPETNGFGASRASMYGSGAKHDGVDFAGPLGHSILAVHGGTVYRTGGVGISDLGKVIIVRSSDGFKEIYQEFGGMGNIKVKTGDVIHTGQRIATLGRLVGAGSGSHVHIGVTRGNPLKMNMLSTNGWYDVTKMHGSSNGTPKSKKGSSTLSKLIKSELYSQLKWIKKYVAPKEDGSIGNFSLSGSIGKRARELAKAFKSAYPSATDRGIAAVLGNWEFESGLNPGAINSGGGASGLGQWLGGRKTALINYARRHGKNWKDASAQIEFALHGDSSDSSILKSILRGSGSVASLAAKFSTDWERGGYTAQHVNGARKVEGALKKLAFGGRIDHPTLGLIGENADKGENEWVINPHKDNADTLIGEVSAYRSRIKGNNHKRSSDKPNVTIKNEWHITGVADKQSLINTYKKYIKPSEQRQLNESIEKYFNDIDIDEEEV